jgi:acyl-CoA thioester hydrolase
VGSHHEIEIRYGEVDLQRVVFNAHYLAYIDDAMDRWMRRLDTDFERLGWDFMLKRAELVWNGAAGLGDTIGIDSEVASWGRTSFTVHHVVRVGDEIVLTADIVYVGVEPGTNRPVPPPPEVRNHLGGPDRATS